jgi:hypothetical protein
MQNDSNLIQVIRLFIKWRLTIISLTIASAVIAALVSLFVLDEYYLSYSVFYPSNQSLTDRNKLFNSEYAGYEVKYFGDKADVNRVLTIANSMFINDYLINKYNLAEHYGIDSNSRYWRTRVRKTFEGNYKAKKTDKDAIEISILDTDPELAAIMVNDVVNKIDELNKEHINEIRRKSVVLFKRQVQDQQEKVDHYIDTLAHLGEKYRIRVNISPNGKYTLEGTNYAATELYRTILDKQENTIKELNRMNNIQDQIEVSLNTNTNSLFILEEAFPAEKRHKPVRSLIVITTSLITLLSSLFAVVLWERINIIRQQL